MKNIVMIIACMALALGIASLAAQTASAKDDEPQQKGEEYKYQQPGKPLYMDPSQMTSQGIDDLHTGSDPMLGKEHEAAGGGSHQRPSGETREEVKVIEGPVRYERVEE